MKDNTNEFDSLIDTLECLAFVANIVIGIFLVLLNF